MTTYKIELYKLTEELHDNLIKLHAQGVTGTTMDDSLDIMSKMMGYFIISGVQREHFERLDKQAELSKHEESWRE